MNIQETHAEFELAPSDAEPVSAGEVRHGITWQTEQGELRCLLPRGLRAEIIGSPNISSLPSKNSWLLGIVNIRGELVPVIDLLKWADLKASVDSASTKQILLIGEGESAIALQAQQHPVLLVTLPSKKTAGSAFAKLVLFTPATFTANEQTWFDLDFKTWLANLSQSKHETIGR